MSTTRQSKSRIITVAALVILLLTVLGPAAAGAASGPQAFPNSRVADVALQDVGQSRPTGFNQPGECIKWVQSWIAQAGGRMPGGSPISLYRAAGALEVPLDHAQRGDVFQISKGNTYNGSPHTGVLNSGRRSDGTFDIVEGNVPTGSGRVRTARYRPTPPPGHELHVWRFGHEAVAAPAAKAVRMGFSRGDGALFRGGDTTAWSPMAGPGASAVAVDGEAMAMIVPWQGAIYRRNDTSPWLTIRDMSTRPTSVAVADNGRLAFTADDGAWFRTCETCAWTKMAGPGASAVAVDGEAMAMIVPWQGAIYRRNDTSPWLTIRDMSTRPTSVAVADNGRLAFTADDGAWFRTCETCAWTRMAGPGAHHVAVDQDRMAMIVPWSGAIFRANDHSPWTTITDTSAGPASVAVSG